MAFRLKSKESVSDGIRRIVKRQIKKTRTQVGRKKKLRKHGARVAPAVAKEARKSFKRVRAALRLVREEIGEDVYRKENWRFRNAGRLLAGIRDAAMLVEATEKLMTPRVEDALEPGAIATILKELMANQREATRRALADGNFATVEAVLTEALARVPDWTIERDAWAAVGNGLGRVYQKNQRALELATYDATVENLHEWRKQTKHLWHQLQLLENALVTGEKPLVSQTHKLSQLLGDDHDLALLREALADDPVTYGGHRVLKGVFAVIDRQREALARQAFVLGRKLYKAPPLVFLVRLEASYAERHGRPKSDTHRSEGALRLLA